MAEVAYIYKWQPSEIYKLTFSELLKWHKEGSKIMEKLYGEQS